MDHLQLFGDMPGKAFQYLERQPSKKWGHARIFHLTRVFAIHTFLGCGEYEYEYEYAGIIG